MPLVRNRRVKRNAGSVGGRDIKSLTPEEELERNVRQFDKAQDKSGLEFLRSLTSHVSRLPGWEAAKPLYHALNKCDYSGAVSYAKGLLAQQYASADETYRHSQIAMFVKKYPFPSNKDVADINAFKKFLKADNRCRHYNRLFRSKSRELDGLSSSKLLPVFSHMQSFVARVLGRAPTPRTLALHARWGPGSCVGVSGKATNFARKFLAEKWTCTPPALELALSVCKRIPEFWELLGLRNCSASLEALSAMGPLCIDTERFDAEFRKRCVLVQHNEILFVPKDSDCSRTIAKEPLLNQFLQLAYGEYIAARLRRIGIDIRDQAANQEMAREGSLGGSNAYCTIDLRSASDSIYIAYVRKLLDTSWVHGLSCCRSPSWVCGDRHGRYNSFMSMGNGFCFPLQTLIFASICSAAHNYCGTDPDYRVYGDDIIVRQNEALVVLDFLRVSGFVANTDKTFIFGPFRESCGADWYDGKPVRPVIVDEPVCTTAGYIRFVNAFWRRAPDHAPDIISGIESRLPKFWRRLSKPFLGEEDEAFACHERSDVRYSWDKNLSCNTWYGVSFLSKPDNGVKKLSGYPVALTVAALTGSSSSCPFTIRRETKMVVRRFAHGGGHSKWLPMRARDFTFLADRFLST